MSHDLVVFVKLGCKSVHIDFFFSSWVAPQSLAFYKYETFLPELPLLLLLVSSLGMLLCPGAFATTFLSILTP